MLERLANLVATHQVRARELVELSLTRIERHNPGLNAVVSLRSDEALCEADALETEIARGARPRPLAGIPVLVKDIEDVAGMVTTYGSLVFAKASPAVSDGLVPMRLKEAGAIIIGKTNTPEFAYEGYTANRLFGMTRNPWGKEWSPGGSSGGSAAALAAGLVPVATATDGGGSIRIPAAACGLAGLKPSNGLVPRRPVPFWIDLSTDGPLGTSFKDVRLLLDVEAGPVDGDPSAVPRWSQRAGVLPRRVLAAERFIDRGPLPAAIHALFWQAVENLSSLLGVPVSKLQPSDLLAETPGGDAESDWYWLCGIETAYHLGADFIREKADLFDPGFLMWMEDALSAPIARYFDARRRRFEYVRRLDGVLGDDAVLLTPCVTLEGFLADGTLPGKDRLNAPDASGYELAALTPTWAYNTPVANMTGHPAASFPAGTSPNGLPFGLQVVGPRFADDLVLNLGDLWEQAHPWPRVAPGYEEYDL